MLSEREVINTLNMLRNEHLDVRTVTLGVSLFDCVSHDIDLFTGNVNVIGLIFALLVLAFIIYMLFFKKYTEATRLSDKAVK